jgi:hypothetical protein
MRILKASLLVAICLSFAPTAAIAADGIRTIVATISNGASSPPRTSTLHDGFRFAEQKCRSRDGSAVCTCERKCIISDDDCECDDPD